MDRKLFGIFSGRQLTAIAITAILAPSVLYGAVATQAVSITDPISGKQSSIDFARRLSVFDPVAGYANSPQNYVRISVRCNSSESGQFYTPPTGKALIVKSVSLGYYKGTSGADNFMYVYIIGVDPIVGFIESEDTSSSRTADLGNGFYIRNGENLTRTCDGGGSHYATIVGYLVPSILVPAADPAEARSGALLTKNGKRL